MAKAIFWFLGCVAFSGASWWSQFIAQVNGGTSGTFWEIVQLGGTGGLVVCLVGAVVALWRDRREMQTIIVDERKAHRLEILAMQTKHTSEVTAATEQLLTELRKQIGDFNDRCDTRYRRKDEQ